MQYWKTKKAMRLSPVSMFATDFPHGLSHVILHDPIHTSDLLHSCCNSVILSAIAWTPAGVLISNPFSMYAKNLSTTSTNQICLPMPVTFLAVQGMLSVRQYLFSAGEVTSPQNQANYVGNKSIPLLHEGKGLCGCRCKNSDGTGGTCKDAGIITVLQQGPPAGV